VIIRAASQRNVSQGSRARPRLSAGTGLPDYRATFSPINFIVALLLAPETKGKELVPDLVVA
jgi:hypothetical protein